MGVQTSRKGIGSGAELMATSVVSNDADLNSTDANLNNICGGGGEMERLQDTVTAYEMQNRFLNKEVLELNQLRTQATDREQKLFM